MYSVEDSEYKIIKRKNGKQKKSLIILLIFFLFLQTKPSFCCMFAWSQLDFSAIPVSIFAVSLTGRQTWQNENRKRNLQRIQNVQEGKRKTSEKEASSCFCLCSLCFWGEVSNSWILNDFGRNFLLGSGKKIAKCLLRTFTGRSIPSSMIQRYREPKRISPASTG